MGKEAALLTDTGGGGPVAAVDGIEALPLRVDGV